MPIKIKLILNDLVIFYRIINSLINIELLKHFAFKDGKTLRYTRQNVDIIEPKHKTSYLYLMWMVEKHFLQNIEA